MSEAEGTVDELDFTAGALNFMGRTAPEREASLRKMFADHSIRVRHTPDMDFIPGRPINTSPHALWNIIRWPPMMSAGSGSLNNFPRKISGVLPGLVWCGLPRVGCNAGRA